MAEVISTTAGDNGATTGYYSFEDKDYPQKLKKKQIKKVKETIPMLMANCDNIKQLKQVKKAILILISNCGKKQKKKLKDIIKKQMTKCKKKLKNGKKAECNKPEYTDEDIAYKYLGRKLAEQMMNTMSRQMLNIFNNDLNKLLPASGKQALYYTKFNDKIND